MNKPVVMTALALAVAVVAAVAMWLILDRYAGQTGVADPLGVTAGADIGGPFTLVDHTGATVTEHSYDGRYRLIYFGYTFCPDVCPVETGTMMAAYSQLGDAGAEIVPLFVTIDPERDTPEVLASYVGLFHEDLIGLTGSEQQIADMAAAYQVYRSRYEDESMSDYLMDHSSFIYLMDRDGNYVTMFRRNTPVDTIVETMTQVLDREAG